MKDDLLLNSVERFSKRSDRLVLEQHDHCEVPAGCGGVVLRWYDPARGLPLRLILYPTERVRLWIDGVEPDSSRPLVPAGRHAFAFRLEGAPTLLLFSAGLDRLTGHRREETPLVVSRADGAWRAVSGEQGPECLHPGFDDSGWEPVVEVESATPEWSEPGAHAHRQLVERGARPISIPGTHEVLWVRREFLMP